MIDANELKDKIKKIRNEYEESEQGIFDSWLKRIENVEALRVLADHFIIKDLIKELNEEIEVLEDVLLNSRELTEVERLNMLDRREFYRGFINRFGVDKVLEEINSQLNNSL